MERGAWALQAIAVRRTATAWHAARVKEIFQQTDSAVKVLFLFLQVLSPESLGAGSWVIIVGYVSFCQQPSANVLSNPQA